MGRRVAWVVITLTAVLLCPSPNAPARAAVVWGSFDSSRINYADGTFTTGTAHSVLRGIVAAHGDSLAPSTPVLTAAYLSGVKVFYTSLLNQSTGTLSASEQTALHSWVAGGGTLIVTADIFPLPAYESFTAFYGITGYSAIGNNTTGTTVNGPHPLTQGVSTFHYDTESTYNIPANSRLLGVNFGGARFMTVMEPATGFVSGGRIVVFGDHNMFTNAYIGMANNTVLAQNLVAWAALPEPAATLAVAGVAALQLLARRRRQPLAA